VLALSGRVEEARERFEALAEYVNPLGLVAEELDTETGADLGNYPQAFSHIGLINSALCVGPCRAARWPIRRRWGSGWATPSCPTGGDRRDRPGSDRAGPPPNHMKSPRLAGLLVSSSKTDSSDRSRIFSRCLVYSRQPNRSATSTAVSMYFVTEPR